MKALNLKPLSSASYGGLLEKIEVLRSSLRWMPGLSSADKQKLQLQLNEVRSGLMLLSRQARLQQSSEETAPPREADSEEQAPALSRQQRRQALLERDFVFEGVFGESPKLLDALEIAERAAPTDLPVLVEGESGTGKELMAKLVHVNGSRADKPFISINCGAIPENLLESELFGHKRGAFTGASNDRKGKFESAHHGTIFLDEVGELPLAGQVKLLRVLQANEIQRVGSDEIIEVDTRIVAATNRNLLQMAREGTFREDLYYRLGVIHVTLPPLRERRDEIPLLIDYFCDEAAEKLSRAPVRMTPALRSFLLTYAYPGNIRELRNLIYRLSCLADEIASPAQLPEDIRPKSKAKASDADELLSLSDIRQQASDAAERAYLEQGLQKVNGKVTELAQRTGMNRSYLQTLLKKHALHSKDYRQPPEK
ncbi:sigma-54 interaction domain-containing protein [Marinobacterium rhizophilum]|uniref:sigma-54 interaction domain-containing protein n=1 Tax=Marinobacterium rhizophilum TaxID=420402 RepID=UPI000369FA18|nr:sigma-54 dependent transcriptional regulator [Marinobacterium rhizophilum]